MKRIISFVLCLVMVCSVMVTTQAAETVFNSSTTFSTALFLISGTNTAGQEFVPGFTSLKGFKVYILNEVSNNTITITVYRGTPDTGVKMHTENLPLTSTTQGWHEFTFSTPLAVSADVKYTFTLHTVGRTIWFGKLGEGSYMAWNYDSSAYGGWVRSNIAAFQAIADYTGQKEPYETVVELIDALPTTITIENEQQVEEAYSAYNALTIEQKGKVTNLEKLNAAKQTIDDLNYRIEHKARFDIQDAIDALGTITAKSGDALKAIDSMLYDYAYEKGTEVVEDIENYETYLTALETYNSLSSVEMPSFGDTDDSGDVTVVDALSALKHVVGKEIFPDVQKLDVNNDGTVSMEDVLLVLQYAVGKIYEFPAEKDFVSEPVEPVNHLLPVYSAKSEPLFENTYASMIGRIQSNGYTQTSLNSSYVGMFGRDSAIQVMAHIAEEDYDHAAKIMKYMVDYHNQQSADYVLHITLNNQAPYSRMVQTDSTFFFLHAWYLYVTNAPESSSKTEFINATEAKVKKFADYFMSTTYFNRTLGLVENPNLEHSREGRYWHTFDLLTNVYASQVWHEMSLYFANKDVAKAQSWAEAAQIVANGINTHLVKEIDGKSYYAELIDLDKVSNKTATGIVAGLEKGFSWVNLSPASCDWYAMNVELMENTYQLYLKYGSVKYYGKYQMLEVYTTYDGSTNVVGNHVIGKGLAWEMLYCKKMGYTDRLRTLVAFVENYSEQMYRETWVYTGGGSDTANQEQASWLLFANKTCFPEMTAINQDMININGLRVATYNIHILSDASAVTIAKDILDAGLDVVGIQEVDKNTIRTGNVDQAKALAEELGWYYGYSKTIDLEGGAYGHAILSKYPILSYTTVQLPSGSEEQRVFGHAIIKVGNHTVNFINTHLTWTTLQSSQFQTIADYIANFDNFIITGDFNCTNFSAYNVLGGNIVNNATNTFITNGDDGAIDNIVVSKNWTVGKGTMVANNHSDHNMLYADVTIK